MTQPNDTQEPIPSLWSRLFRRERQADPVSLAVGSIDPSGADLQTTLQGLVAALLRDRGAERRSRILKASIYFMIFGLPFLVYLCGLIYMNGSRWFTPADAVGVVRIEGDIGPGSRTASAAAVIPALKAAFESDKIKAVVLAIDSSGGAPVESERITNAIATLKQQHPKPIVSVIGNGGMSAAYMIAMHTDRIYAGKYSLVGSIGAVMATWDFHKALEKVDVAQRVYASGPLKAMLNPYLPMTDQANDKAQQLVNTMGKEFNDELRSLRKALKPGVQYATGEAWGGNEALALGVIDELGTIDDVIERKWKLPAHDFGPGSDGFEGLHAASVINQLIRSVMSAPSPTAESNVTLR